MPVYCPPVSGDRSRRWNFMPLALATGPIKPGQALEHHMVHIIKGNVLGWPSLWQQASHDPSVTMVPGIFVVVALSDNATVSSSSPRSWWLWIYRGSQVTVQGKLYIGDAYDSPGWVQNYAGHMVGPTASIGQDLECMEVLNTSNVRGQGRQPIVIGAGMEIAMVARHLVNHDGAHWSIQLIDEWH